mgnify:CR=1 FL=1
MTLFCGQLSKSAQVIHICSGATTFSSQPQPYVVSAGQGWES